MCVREGSPSEGREPLPPQKSFSERELRLALPSCLLPPAAFVIGRRLRVFCHLFLPTQKRELPLLKTGREGGGRRAEAKQQHPISAPRKNKTRHDHVGSAVEDGPRQGVPAKEFFFFKSAKSQAYEASKQANKQINKQERASKQASKQASSLPESFFSCQAGRAEVEGRDFSKKGQSFQSFEEMQQLCNFHICISFIANKQASERAGQTITQKPNPKY